MFRLVSTTSRRQVEPDFRLVFATARLSSVTYRVERMEFERRQDTIQFVFIKSTVAVTEYGLYFVNEPPVKPQIRTDVVACFIYLFIIFSCT